MGPSSPCCDFTRQREALPVLYRRTGRGARLYFSNMRRTGGLRSGDRPRGGLAVGLWVSACTVFLYFRPPVFPASRRAGCLWFLGTDRPYSSPDFGFCVQCNHLAPNQVLRSPKSFRGYSRLQKTAVLNCRHARTGPVLEPILPSTSK